MQLWEKNGELYLTLGLYVDLNEDEDTPALPLATDPDFALPERVPPSAIEPAAQEDAADEEGIKSEPATPTLSAGPQQRGPFAAANMNGIHSQDEIQNDVDYEEEGPPSRVPNGLPVHTAS